MIHSLTLMHDRDAHSALVCTDKVIVIQAHAYQTILLFTRSATRTLRLLQEIHGTEQDMSAEHIFSDCRWVQGAQQSKHGPDHEQNAQAEEGEEGAGGLEAGPQQQHSRQQRPHQQLPRFTITLLNFPFLGTICLLSNYGAFSGAGMADLLLRKQGMKAVLWSIAGS